MNGKVLGMAAVATGIVGYVFYKNIYGVPPSVNSYNIKADEKTPLPKQVNTPGNRPQDVIPMTSGKTTGFIPVADTPVTEVTGLSGNAGLTKHRYDAPRPQTDLIDPSPTLSQGDSSMKIA